VSSGELRYDGATTDALGRRHVRFEQVAGGVPVYDGAVTVHLARDADALTGFTAGVTRAGAGAATMPSIGADQARDVATQQVPDSRLVQAPRLVVYTGVPLGSHPATLAWAVDLSSTSRPDRNDVTAHELTHAVTERTAALEYQGQAGALNESISDQAGWDVDPGDTTMGEDLPIGAIRDMQNPGAYGQPATASQYVCRRATTARCIRTAGSRTRSTPTSSAPSGAPAPSRCAIARRRRTSARTRRSPTRGQARSRPRRTSASTPARSAPRGSRRA
jgi:Zn-dependent metalloprotease